MFSSNGVSDSKEDIPSAKLLFAESGLKEAFDLPEHITDLQLITHHDGGSGGVYEIKINNKIYMLKMASSEEHLKLEALADTLYLRMGANAPRFGIYKGIPKSIQDLLGVENKSDALFRLSEKIEGQHPQIDNINITSNLTTQMKQFFVLDAYLRNRDVAKWDNIIETESGEVYRIDNGSILSMRARGQEDVDNIEHVIELETLRNLAYHEVGSWLYKDLSKEEIAQQKQHLIEQSGMILSTALSLHKILNIDYFESIYSQLVYRMQSLAYDRLSDAGHSFASVQYLVKQPATTDLAAGILSYTYKNGEYYVLLGNKTGSDEDSWGYLSGQCDNKDINLHDTAVRTIKEATNGLITHDPDTIRYHPFFEVESDRLYLSPTPYQSIDEFNRRLGYASKEGEAQYSEFAWVSLKSLAVNQGETMTVDILSNQGVIEEKEIKLFPGMIKLFEKHKENFNEFVEALPEKPVVLPLHQAHIKDLVAKQMYLHAEVIQELKKKFNNKTINLDEIELESKPCLSEIYMDQVLQNQDQSIDLETKLNTFLKSAVLDNENLELYNQTFKEQMIKVIQRERDFQSKGFYTLYHAAPREIVILYDLFTELYRHLNYLPDETYRRFRLSETAYKSLPTLDEFIQHFEREGEDIDNYAGIIRRWG